MGNYSARFGGGHLEKGRKAPRQVSTLQNGAFLFEQLLAYSQLSPIQIEMTRATPGSVVCSRHHT